MIRLVLLFGTLLFLSAQAVAQPTLERSVVGCGAPAGTSGSLSLRSTVGQSVTGVSTRVDPLGHQAGFWYQIVLADVSAVFDEPANPPKVLALRQNHPNPFNPLTTIVFDLPRRQHVRLCVFDLRGRLVHTLVNELFEADRHEIRFDGTALASGVYFYRLESADGTRTRRLVLLK